MLIQSQPLAPEICVKLELEDKSELSEQSEQTIKAQRIGKMFDDIESKIENRKISLGDRFDWWKRELKSAYYNLKYAVRNHFKWRKTINQLRPWEGFSGLLCVMQTHLQDYIETEEKCGHSTVEYKQQKITSAKDTVVLLERMQDPHDYISRRRDKVEEKYPEYKYLITEYQDGSVSYSGCFVRQGIGWVGKESGKNPHEGYFEFFKRTFQSLCKPPE